MGKVRYECGGLVNKHGYEIRKFWPVILMWFNSYCGRMHILFMIRIKFRKVPNY